MADPYDVFLSHSSADKPEVEAIAVRLRDEAGLRPFLDKWALVPGEPWIPALERALEQSTTVAVFFGSQGRGAWHDQETQLALVIAAEERGKRVIPVLLPGARKEDVGGFMRLRTWVELAQEDGFARLVAGVTGRAPGPGAGAPSGTDSVQVIVPRAAVSFPGNEANAGYRSPTTAASAPPWEQPVGEVEDPRAIAGPQVIHRDASFELRTMNSNDSPAHGAKRSIIHTRASSPLNESPQPLLEQLFGDYCSTRSRGEKAARILGATTTEVEEPTTKAGRNRTRQMFIPMRNDLGKLPNVTPATTAAWHENHEIHIAIPDMQKVTIGKHIDCHVRINEGGVSSLHAILENCQITDCSSKNGTWVNGLRIMRCTLHTNDIVDFGETSFVYINKDEDGRPLGKTVAILAVDIHHSINETTDPYSEEDQARRFVIREIATKTTDRPIESSFFGREATIIRCENKDICLRAFERIAESCKARTRGVLPLELCGGVAMGCRDEVDILIWKACERLEYARLCLDATCIAPED